MPEEINLQAVIDQLQAENEDLRIRVSQLLLNKEATKDVVFNYFNSLDWQSKYFLIASICMIVLALSGIVRDLRG